MLKSVQIKIVLIFMILGIFMLTVQGFIFTAELQDVSQQMIGNEQVISTIQTHIKQVQLITIILIVTFTIISILVGAFVAKTILEPIAKLTKSAENAAKGGQYAIKYLADGKNKTEVDELANAFSMMHSELNENLKEVSRQKKQIETILLHMNDGILAFNLNGEIIHKNNAADKLFGLTGTEKNFNEIFDKLDVDIKEKKL